MQMQKCAWSEALVGDLGGYVSARWHVVRGTSSRPLSKISSLSGIKMSTMQPLVHVQHPIGHLHETHAQSPRCLASSAASNVHLEAS